MVILCLVPTASFINFCAISSLLTAMPTVRISEHISSKVIPFNEIISVLDDNVHKLFFNVACILSSEIEHTSHNP